MGVHEAHHPVIPGTVPQGGERGRHTVHTGLRRIRRPQRRGSPVERAVVDRLTDKEQRRYDAVRAAISETEVMKHGRQRMELIDRVYWKRSHTLYGAAMCALVSERTAKRWSAEFVRTVEKYLDLP